MGPRVSRAALHLSAGAMAAERPIHVALFHLSPMGAPKENADHRNAAR